jgi:hypothetical protein
MKSQDALQNVLLRDQQMALKTSRKSTGCLYCQTNKAKLFLLFFFLISAVGLWVLQPLLAYCTSPG